MGSIEHSLRLPQPSVWTANLACFMAIAGAAIEVVQDARQLRPQLLAGIVLALVGGYLATGVRLADSSFGLGGLVCVNATSYARERSIGATLPRTGWRIYR